MASSRVNVSSQAATLLAAGEGMSAAWQAGSGSTFRNSICNSISGWDPHMLNNTVAGAPASMMTNPFVQWQAPVSMHTSCAPADKMPPPGLMLKPVEQHFELAHLPLIHPEPHQTQPSGPSSHEVHHHNVHRHHIGSDAMQQAVLDPGANEGASGTLVAKVAEPGTRPQADPHFAVFSNKPIPSYMLPPPSFHPQQVQQLPQQQQQLPPPGPSGRFTSH